MTYGRIVLKFLNEKQDSSGTQRKPKMDAARRLKGISYIASDDQEFDTVVKHARRKLETHMESAMLCKGERNSEKKTLNHSMSTSWGGNLEQKHSWETPHAPKKKKNQIQFMLTKLMLTNLHDPVSTKAANKSTKSTLQTMDTIL